MNELYTFTPDEDITAYELSLVMKEMILILIHAMQGSSPDANEPLQIPENDYNVLPVEIQKHFSKS